MQAFDRFVAKAGKKRAAKMLDLVRRSHITAIMDQWFLVLVGLSMLRDCDQSNVWESSFMAVNMHPLHRISFEDWLKKINGFVVAAAKFDSEVIDVTELLPKSWLTQPLSKRQKWLKIIKEEKESWDVDLVSKLRSSGMSLSNLSQIFKIYHAEMSIASSISTSDAPGTPPVKKKAVSITPTVTNHQKGHMIYHLFKVPGSNMTPAEKFQHMVKVRNRTFGPTAATTVSPPLGCACFD